MNSNKNFRKKAMAVTLTATMLFSAIAPMTALAGDVDGHWAAGTLKQWQGKGLIKGDENGNVQPDKAVTRAELVSLIARALTLKDGTTKDFADVAKGAWYYSDLQKCVSAGIIGGYEDNSFHPEAAVTRAEMAKIICGVQKLEKDEAGANSFADSATLPAWAKGYIGAANKAGLMTGSDGNRFDGDSSLSKAEAIAVMERGMGGTVTGEVAVDPTFYTNTQGPTIGVTVKSVLDISGKKYRDANGNGTLEPYEDWNLTPEQRAKDLVSRMTVEEKAGQMVINSRGMGINQKDQTKTSYEGLLDEEAGSKTNIFGTLETYGTLKTIKDLKIRHFILRQNPKPADFATWINTMNQVAEEDTHGIPVVIASNSRNENAEVTFGMNDASGIFSVWPGTMGLAAAAKGDIAKGGDARLISEFAEIARSEWDACGIKKGYMYMADTMTDPRWQRTYGTFGEDTAFIADVMTRLVKGFQGEKGLATDGVAMTVKHFPGGGARENGFDPHYAEGQWNIYATPGSLEKYHLPPFQAAIDAGVSSIMPYYAKPSEDKSMAQTYKGQTIDFEAVGFAFNDMFIKELLREKMGHEGYVNSDSGIIDDMAWGVEHLNHPQRAAKAINTGTDIISDTNNVWAVIDAYNQKLITEERMNEANVRLLKEAFQLGLFDNPYRDPANAKKVVENKANWDKAYIAHQKSVVLLKNSKDENSAVLPLTDAKLKGKKVYVEYFAKTAEKGMAQTEALRKSVGEDKNVMLTNDYKEADYALLFVDPESGDYFNATMGLLELDICEDKDVQNCVNGIPVAETHKETSVVGVSKIKEIADAVHANKGKVVSNVNFELAWLLGNIEPISDAVLAGFNTYTAATMDVIRGRYNPTGKMPITLPASEAVIAVDDKGVSISANDVPGYAKVLPNGMAYGYKDADGNSYMMDYGLSFK